MAYNLDAPDHELAYWDSLPLSTEAEERIKKTIADISDEFRLNPENRLKPNAPYFIIEHVFLDSWGDGRPHRMDFYIRDDKAEYGVLLIAYIELLQ